MKAARDAAKKGGVDTKEIARIFSLNIISSGDQGAQPAKPMDPAPAPVETTPEPAQPVEPTPAPLEFKLGGKVRVDGLTAKPELNGLTGVLVAQKEDKWQVLLDNNGGMKLFKEKNLT